MSLTRIPGFSAAAAVGRSMSSYESHGVEMAASSSLVPQLVKGNGDDIGHRCLVLCYCCGRWGNRYCCVGCELCDIVLSGGILA